jgi:hypothetical protein
MPLGARMRARSGVGFLLPRLNDRAHAAFSARDSPLQPTSDNRINNPPCPSQHDRVCGSRRRLPLCILLPAILCQHLPCAAGEAAAGVDFNGGRQSAPGHWAAPAAAGLAGACRDARPAARTATRQRLECACGRSSKGNTGVPQTSPTPACALRQPRPAPAVPPSGRQAAHRAAQGRPEVHVSCAEARRGWSVFRAAPGRGQCVPGLLWRCRLLVCPCRCPPSTPLPAHDPVCARRPHLCSSSAAAAQLLVLGDHQPVRKGAAGNRRDGRVGEQRRQARGWRGCAAGSDGRSRTAAAAGPGAVARSLPPGPRAWTRSVEAAGA